MREPTRLTGAGTRSGEGVTRLPFGDVVQAFALSHGLNFVLVNALARLPLQSDRLAATARLGAGLSLPHAEVEIERRRTEQYQIAGPAIQASGGLELRVRGPLRATVEYEWTYARPQIAIDSGRRKSRRVLTTSHSAWR